jgi:hypothetical protein
VGRRPERRSGSGRILSSLSIIIRIETLRNKIMEPYELGMIDFPKVEEDTRVSIFGTAHTCTFSS